MSDSVGRPWRVGIVGLAIGTAGLPALCDLRGDIDLFGRPLRVTQTGFADQLASAATLVMGEAAEGSPIVWIGGLGGLARREPSCPTASLIRPPEDDLFR
jgi:coenzyme F420-0:L-glutamate ligase/coenzyme F420-1:gamma-L-glutamate ligase